GLVQAHLGDVVEEHPILAHADVGDRVREVRRAAGIEPVERAVGVQPNDAPLVVNGDVLDAEPRAAERALQGGGDVRAGLAEVVEDDSGSPVDLAKRGLRGGGDVAGRELEAVKNAGGGGGAVVIDRLHGAGDGDGVQVRGFQQGGGLQVRGAVHPLQRD